MSATATPWGSRSKSSSLDPGVDIPWVYDGEIKSASATHQEAFNHVATVEPELKFVTGHVGLGNLENCRADPVKVPNA